MYMYIYHILEPDQISQTQSIWWLREVSQTRQTFNPIEPAILAAIGHFFLASKNTFIGFKDTVGFQIQ